MFEETAQRGQAVARGGGTGTSSPRVGRAATGAAPNAARASGSSQGRPEPAGAGASETKTSRSTPLHLSGVSVGGE